MTKKSLFLLISVFSLAAVSCVREPNGNIGGTSSKVVFNIGSEQALTKASSSFASVQCDPIDVSEEFGIENLVMTEVVTNLDVLQGDLSSTKGTPIYTNNLVTFYDGKLGVTVYSGSDFSTKLLSEAAYSNDSGSNCWSHDYGYDFWPKDGSDLLFVLRAPTDMAGVTDFTCVNSSNTGTLNSGSKGTGTGTISFSYSDPGAGKSNSAELQKDLLFSTKKMNKAQNESTSHPEHNVLLYHALTGVTFQLKDAGSDNVVLTSIDKITINNVTSSGSCAIKPVYEGYTTDSNVGPNDVDKSSSAVQWNLTSANTANVSQSYGDDEVVEGTPAAKAEHTFMLVPQTVSDDVTLTIEYTYKAKVANGEWVSYSGNKATLNLGSKLTDKTWAAGELHTFQFTISQSVNVEIDDTVDADTRTKSSLTITNTGTATSYMRVAVIGNWVYTPEAGEVGEDNQPIPVSITPCSQANLAAIIEAAKGNDWITGSDGFYYYKHPVPGGHTISSTNTLFDSVSFEDFYDDYQPYDECALHVDIAVQAIRADQVADGWPAAIVTQLDNDVID